MIYSTSKYIVTLKTGLGVVQGQNLFELDGETEIRVGDKVIKLREERQLLGRFLIIQGSRPELVPKLEKTIGEYEMSVVPRSLCAVDGSLYIPADKASLMHAIEGAKAQTVRSVTRVDAAQTQVTKSSHH